MAIIKPFYASGGDSMAMPLTYYGNPVLRQVAQPVRKVSADIKKLVDEMFDTMAKENGIGLAAPQVGVSKRVIVLDLSHEGIAPFALINPEIIKGWGEELDSEGCLSIPGVFMQVTRYRKIKIKARDAKDRAITMEAEGLLARAIQHEIDHLDGKLFVDYIDDKHAVEEEIAKMKARLAEQALETPEAVLPR